MQGLPACLPASWRSWSAVCSLTLRPGPRPCDHPLAPRAGLPPAAGRLWLYETFSRFGPVAGVRVPTELPTGVAIGSAYVFFSDATAAQRACLAMDGAQVGPCRVRVTARAAPATPAVSAPASPLLAPLLPAPQLGSAPAAGDLQAVAAAVLAAAAAGLAPGAGLAAWPPLPLAGLGGAGLR